MWLSLLLALLVLSFLALGGAGFCSGLWQYRPAIWAMCKTVWRHPRGRTSQAETLAHPYQPSTVLTLYKAVQTWRVRRYLHAHTPLALDIMRQSPETAALAVRTLLAMEARGEAPKRETFQYPQLLYGQ